MDMGHGSTVYLTYTDIRANVLHFWPNETNRGYRVMDEDGISDFSYNNMLKIVHAQWHDFITVTS